MTLFRERMPAPGRLLSLSGKEAQRAALVGCGFALAFGWVWSGALRDLLFSDLLTGTMLSGQGTTLFFSALVAVFFLGGVIMAFPKGSVRKRLPGFLFPALAHGAALLPLGAPFVFPGPAAAPAVAVALGLSGGLAGLFWGSILLQLRMAGAGLAITVAWAGVSGLVILLRLQPVVEVVAFPLVVQAACSCMALLLALGVFTRKEPTEPAHETKPALWEGTTATAVALFLAVTALGALFSAEGYGQPGLMEQCGLETAGALLAVLFFLAQRTMENRSWRVLLFTSLALPVALPLALLPLAKLWSPVFSRSLHLGTGMLLTVAVMRLADGRQTNRGEGSDLAGLALAGLPMALNLGFFAGTRTALFWERENAGLFVLLLALLAVLFVLSRRFGGEAERRRTEIQEAGMYTRSFPGQPYVFWRVFRERLSVLSRAEISRALVIGIGFAMVMGWIWFPGMQILCPPLLRNVAPPMGEGAMLFLGTISLGYPLLGLGISRVSGRLSPHLLHGATLPFIFMLIWQPPASPGFVLLFSLLAGMASICAGLYWLTLLFSQKRICAGLSFVMSGIAAVFFSFIATFLPPAYLNFFLPLLIACAWPLVFLRPQPPARREASRVGNAFSSSGIWFLVPALFLLGFLEKLLLAGNGPANPALLCLCSALGGMAGLTLNLAAPGMRGWKIVCLAILLPIPGLMAGLGAALSQCATGMVSVLVVMELSVFFDRIRANKITATGVVAGGIAMLFNIGYAIGDGVISAMPQTELVTVIVSLSAAGTVVFLESVVRRARHGLPAGAAFEGCASEDEGESAAIPTRAETKPDQTPQGPDARHVAEPPDQGLTFTERRIAALLRQNYTNAAISEALDIAPTTTRVHLRNIHKKMETGSREELVERLQRTAGS